MRVHQSWQDFYSEANFDYLDFRGWPELSFRCWSGLRETVQDLGPQWVYLFDDSTWWFETWGWRTFGLGVHHHRFFPYWKNWVSGYDTLQQTCQRAENTRKQDSCFCGSPPAVCTVWQKQYVGYSKSLSTPKSFKQSSLMLNKSVFLTLLCLVKKGSFNFIHFQHLIRGREDTDCNRSLRYLAIFITWATSQL